MYNIDSYIHDIQEGLITITYKDIEKIGIKSLDIFLVYCGQNNIYPEEPSVRLNLSKINMYKFNIIFLLI